MSGLRALLLALLAIAVVALAAVAWRQYLELIPYRASGLGIDPLADKRRLDEIDRRIKTLRRRLERTAAAAKGRPGETAGASAAARWNQSPEAKAAMAAIRRYWFSAAIDRHYAALFKRLSLSPEQLAEFKGMIAEKKAAVIDAIQIAREQGLEPRSPTFQQAMLQASASVDAEIMNAIGPEAFSEFQQYDSTLPERNAVTLIAGHLDGSNALSADEIEELVQLFAQNRPAAANQWPAYIIGNATAPISNGDVQAAAPLLSDAQLQAVEAAQQQQAEKNKLIQMIYQLQHPAKG